MANGSSVWAARGKRTQPGSFAVLKQDELGGLIGTDWDAVFLELAKAYGWRPTEIAALTPAQLDLYLDALRESGICWMSPTELRAWRRRGANDEES